MKNHNVLHNVNERFNNKKKRDKRVIEAVARYGHSQREIADNLDMHYATISRIINER